MSVATEATEALALILGARRSTRRLAPAEFSARLLADLREAAALTPSAFDARPWRVVAVRERNEDFWDRVEETIRARLAGERRERYLARAAGMRAGGLTLLIFEDRALAAPRDGLTEAEAADQTSQGLGMLQFALWLVITGHGLATSLQHWHAFLEDAALDFAGLPAAGFRLVAFMPVGAAAESVLDRPDGPSRFVLERWQEAGGA